MKSTLKNYTKEQFIALIEEQENVLSTTQEKAENLLAKNVELEKKKASLEDENAWLKYQVAQLKQKVFGQSRERFEKAPLPELPFEMEESKQEEVQTETVEAISYQRKKNKSNHKGRQPLPEHLPVEEIEIYPEGDLEGMVCIGKEVTDELEYQPEYFFIKRYIRYKYAPKNKENKAGILIGSLPERIFPKGIFGIGLLTAILVNKYMDHMPLFRQGQRFKRANIPIARSTLEGRVRWGLEMLDILYQYLIKDVRSKGYLQADETTIKVLESDKKGKCHLGFYWVYNSPIDGMTLFDYQPNRSTESGMQILDNFKGYLQTDGYSGYNRIAKSEGVVHLACWAHARREFVRAMDNDKPRAEMALLFIQGLYAVEKKARENNLNPEERKELRLKESLPVIKAFGKWMYEEVEKGKLLPKSQIGKAINYTLKRWTELQNYLYDGILEIDNNLVENAIRPVALGRKNYLFAGSHESAKRAASIYSFFAICKQHDVNPYEWLKYVFENLNETKVNRLYELYPQNYKKLNKT